MVLLEMQNQLHHSSPWTRKTVKYKDTGKIIFLASLFTVVKKWSQSRSVSTDERIMKMRHIQTMTFYAVAKKNEIGKFARKWMDLGMVILREVTRTQKDDAYYLSYVDHRF